MFFEHQNQFLVAFSDIFGDTKRDKEKAKYMKVYYAKPPAYRPLIIYKIFNRSMAAELPLKRYYPVVFSFN
jgi:hypothetical protein